MLERMIIPRIENRILVGIIAFLGTMVLLGWAAINEGGRMQAFERTYTARSIELGAALFASNCATCHGPQGYGGPKGPALNNPQLFSHDFFPDITKEISNLQVERAALEREAGLPNTTAERRTAIDARIQEIDARVQQLDAPRREQLQVAVDRGYDPQRPSRLANVGWAGTREAFIKTTLIHGRPASIKYWPGAMVAWSQTAGGPLRDDQIDDLVNYITNWDKGDAWTIDDLFAVQQFAKEPEDPAPYLAMIQQLQASGGELQMPVGSNVADVVAQLATVTGDPARGDAIYHGTQRTFNGNMPGCSGCHMPAGPGVGPQTGGTWTRILNERLNDPALSGYTPEQYLAESILQPANYIVPGFQNLMPAYFGDQLSIQDLADLIAYLATQTQ